MRLQPVKEIARGRWHSILPAFGIDRRLLDGKHHACPICGGKDRFRFTNFNADGVSICNSCGSRDGYALVEAVTRLPFRDIHRRVAEVVGQAPADLPVVQPDERASRAEMKRVWEAATALKAGSAVSQYLEARVGPIRASAALREDGGMMVARVSDVRDRGVNLHRTFVPRDGWKPGVAVKRLLMRGTLPDGCAVRLWPAGEVLGIAEGIETAISASRLFKGIPVWAALNAQNLAKWTPPEGVQQVVIFGDNDRSYTGQEAAYTLARRLARTDGLKVTVEIPPTAGHDWNDVWNME